VGAVHGLINPDQCGSLPCRSVAQIRRVKGYSYDLILHVHLGLDGPPWLRPMAVAARQTTVAAPLELVGARQPEPSGEQNSLSFHPTQPERCGELTWVVLERRGTEARHLMTRLRLQLWATAGEAPRTRRHRGLIKRGGGGCRWLAGHRFNRGRLVVAG
jgi:hypothetical protein